MQRPSVSALDLAWHARDAGHRRPRHPDALPPLATLRFALPRPMPVAIRVMSSEGRLICTLYDGSLEPGEHVARWDGLDDAGMQAATGSYTLCIEADGKPLTSRVIARR